MILLSSSAGSVVALAGLAWITWYMFDTARRRAGQSPRLRRLLVAGGLLQIAVGGVVAFWLPFRVPDTPGSPAALVGMLLLWIVGGLLLYSGAIGLLGAAFARAPAPEGTAGE
jgi:hypothetical protein